MGRSNAVRLDATEYAQESCGVSAWPCGDFSPLAKRQPVRRGSPLGNTRTLLVIKTHPMGEIMIREIAEQDVATQHNGAVR